MTNQPLPDQLSIAAWTIRWQPYRHGHGGGWRLDPPGVDLPASWPADDPVPVVPCDDAAVERVARLLFARSFVPMQTVEQVTPLWNDMEDDRREFLRDAAREVLAAAGSLESDETQVDRNDTDG